MAGLSLFKPAAAAAAAAVARTQVLLGVLAVLAAVPAALREVTAGPRGVALERLPQVDYPDRADQADCKIPVVMVATAAPALATAAAAAAARGNGAAVAEGCPAATYPLAAVVAAPASSPARPMMTCRVQVRTPETPPILKEALSEMEVMPAEPMAIPAASLLFRAVPVGAAAVRGLLLI